MVLDRRLDAVLEGKKNAIEDITRPTDKMEI